MLKVYNSAVAAGAANGVANEVFIPVQDLLGGYPLTDVDPKVVYAQGLLMFAEKVFSILSPSGFMKLGQTVTKSGNGNNSNYTFAFSLSTTLVSSSNPASGLVNATVLPVPTVGENLGIGGYAFTDIFPNAQKVPVEGAISGVGISFTVDDLEEYGSGSYAAINLGSDCRQLLMSMYFDIAFNQETRQSGTTSAILSSSLSAVSNFSITEQLVNEVNGTVGLPLDELDNVLAGTRTASFSIQTELTSADNSYNVLVA